MAISVSERRERIVQLATLSGLANVETLAQHFGVTPSTIRRDLSFLADEGRLARTYGGAISIVAHSETTVNKRLGEAAPAKRAIARWAASCVNPGESLLLDGGTTVGALARELRLFDNLTVSTTSLTAIEELASNVSIRVECLGGTLRRVSKSLVGPLAEYALEKLTFDRAFLGADGVRADRGICEAVLEQTRLKELMARASEVVYVLAHGSKVGHGSFHAWAQLPTPWTLVTDESADPEDLSSFREAGIETVVVGLDGDVREKFQARRKHVDSHPRQVVNKQPMG